MWGVWITNLLMQLVHQMQAWLGGRWKNAIALLMKAWKILIKMLAFVEIAEQLLLLRIPVFHGLFMKLILTELIFMNHHCHRQQNINEKV